MLRSRRDFHQISKDIPVMTVDSSCRSQRRCITHCCAQSAPVLAIPRSPRQPAAPSLGSPPAAPAGSALLGKGIKRKAGFMQFICSSGECLTRQRKPEELCQPGRSALLRPGGIAEQAGRETKHRVVCNGAKSICQYKTGGTTTKGSPSKCSPELLLAGVLLPFTGKG